MHPFYSNKCLSLFAFDRHLSRIALKLEIDNRKLYYLICVVREIDEFCMIREKIIGYDRFTDHA